MSDEKRIAHYFSFSRQLRSRLPSEELQRLNDAVTRSMEDPVFYKALLNDPQTVLEDQFAIQPETLTLLAEALADVPRPQFSYGVPLSPDSYFKLEYALRETLTSEELQSLNKAVSHAIEDPIFFEALLENPSEVLSEQHGISWDTLSRLSAAMDELRPPRPFGFPRR